MGIQDAFKNVEKIITALVGVAIILVIAIVILSELKGTLDSGSAEANATQDVLDQVLLVVGFLGVIVIAGIGAVLLGMVKSSGFTAGS